jgi:SDR family mycofactocin-dependent oxidoreductase
VSDTTGTAPRLGRVEGKVALITGAARGQGRAHAVRLAQEGADVILVDICAPIAGVPYAPATEDDLQETVKAVEALDRRAVSVVADIRDQTRLRAAVDDAVAELGGLDIVVANAGINIAGQWHEITEQVFRDVVEVNLFGTWNTLMVGAPHLVARGGGSIIVTSSASGIKGLPFLTPYAASKHAVLGLARVFAAELAKDNVRVNTLHPAGVRTEMTSPAAMAAYGEGFAANPRLVGMYQNMLDVETTEPEDQANAVLFLASDESRYVTANAMTVDLGSTQY